MEERPPEFREPSPPFEPPPPPPPAPPAAEIIPWERPGVNAFEGFGRTIQMLLRAPARAYASMPIDASFGRPLIFGILTSWIGVLAGTFWNLLLRGWMQEMLPWADERWNEMSGTMRIVSAMVAPVWIPIALLIGAGIQHLFLFVVGGARNGFAATFRVQCYAAAPMVLAIIPACGSIAALIGSCILAIIGLAAAHRISRGKAAAAVLLPALLCCGCIGIGIAIFGAAIFGALGMNR
jgi:hypothetical protein